jgi:hypothetical protein
MSLRYTILYLLICLSLPACEEAANFPLTTENSNLVVVEGTLTNENINHRIKLTRPYKTQNETPEPISGAAVTLKDETSTYILTESPVESGEYYTPQMRAVTGRVYTLTIVYNEKEYTARDSSVPVEALEAIQYKKTGDRYELVFSPSLQEPNFIEYTIDWRNTDACTGACSGRLVYYDLKTIDVNEIYKPDKEPFLFPVGATIVRKKYSVSTTYREFLRSMLSETEWRGGVFDVQRDNVSTNLSEGAVGFFAVSTVVADTTVITE